jgi:hypothetical protein
MQEALEWAADYAERNKLFAPIRNERGYADNWKPPTPADKLAVITQLAQSTAAPDSASSQRDWGLLADEVARLERLIKKIANTLPREEYETITGLHDNLFELARRNGGI